MNNVHEKIDRSFYVALRSPKIVDDKLGLMAQAQFHDLFFYAREAMFFVHGRIFEDLNRKLKSHA